LDKERPGGTVIAGRYKEFTEELPELKEEMIDYFQLLRSASRENNRQLEVSEISAELKQLAKELSIPVIVVTQLTGNRIRVAGPQKAVVHG
jgi:replicative DNA helicase